MPPAPSWRPARRVAFRHIVLVSVLGADPDSANRYLRSKGRAERIVADSGLSAAIIRTPILLGPGTAGARAVVHAASQADGHAARRRASLNPARWMWTT